MCYVRLGITDNNCNNVLQIRVRVQRTDDVLEVCPKILTEDGMQAQHLGATLALYNMVKGQVRDVIMFY